MAIYVYEDKRGNSPFVTWYQKLQKKEPAIFEKMTGILQEMEEDKLELVRPRVKKMLARTNYRHLYKMRLGKYRLFFLCEHHDYYLLHAFRKSSQTTPEKEIRAVTKEIESQHFIPLTK